MKKAIIMGNGESLNELPPSVLSSLPSYGVNYAKYQPTYYVCVDHELLTRHHIKVYDLAKRAKVAYLPQKELGSSNIYELPNVELVTHDRDVFSTERYFSGLTVVYVALKIAYYAGFDEVNLWGVDFNPEWTHYRPDYPQGDVERRAWRMEEMYYHFELAARVYNDAGKAIVNHSHPSKLDSIFQRKENI